MSPKPLLALVALAGCQLLGPSPEERADITFAHALPSCGPTDGGALVLLFTEEEIDCDAAFDIAGGLETPISYTRVDWFDPRSLDSLQTFRFDTDTAATQEDLAWAAGRQCDDFSCVRAQSGAVSLVQTSRETIHVDAILRFPERDSVRHTVEAFRCNRFFTCP